MSGDAHESQRGQAAAPKASADVFISYASQDKAVADAVCKALESAGVACWIAPRDVTPGEFYAESIVHAIDSAKVLVLVLSQNAAVSQHVLREVERASTKRRPVVSLRTDLEPLPAGLEYFLNTSQWLDASATGVDRALPRLVDAVRSALAQPPAVARVNPDPAVTTRASPRPSRMLVALAVIVATVLAYVVVDKFWLSKRVDEQQPVVEATPAISEKSIAVLPFVNMSSDKEQEYFSDGLSEELLNLLTKIPQLQVAARTSSFYYKGKEVKLEEIARELHVAHLLEGSVRKSGNRVRITAQLIRAADGYHQWSETYDRTLKDIFAVQDEISAAVVEHLKIVLLGEKRQAQRVDARAYDLFLQARQQARLHTAEGYQQATTLYQQGLKIDDTYPPAWSGLAYVYRRQANNGMLPLEEGYALAAEALKKTLAINPDFAPAQAEVGRIALDHDGDLAAAAKYLEQALSLEPANSDILGYSAIFADSLGRLDQGVAINQYALQRDPVNPTLHNALGLEYRNNGQLDRAIDSFRTVLSLSPEDIGAHYHIGEALLLKGEFEAALAEIQKEPFEAWRMIGLPMAYHSLKRKRESDEALAALIAKYSETWPYNIAYVLAWRGEKDRAFEFLEKARVVHDPGLSDLAMEILFANIRGNARWNPFLRKLGKTPEQLAAIKFEVKLPQ